MPSRIAGTVIFLFMLSYSMTLSPMYTVQIIASHFFAGYQIVVIILLLCKWLLKRQAVLWRALLYTSNVILLFTAFIYGLAYGSELFMACYSQVTYEQQAFKWRVTGFYWYTYWILIILPFLAPQLFWFRRLRNSFKISFLMLPLLSFGFLFERLVIILTSGYQDYLPSGWKYYGPHPLELLFSFSLFCLVLCPVYFLLVRKKEHKCASGGSVGNV